MDIAIRPLPPEKKKNAEATLKQPLGFGKLFTDRMFRVWWNAEKGWHNAEIGPYEPIVLDPAALVLHYAQEIFEGLKAYRWPDGTIGFYRPEMNAKRMNTSAARLVMPEMPVEDQLQAYESLVKESAEWIPSERGYALYLRPTMIATNPSLGVKPGDEYLFYIICSPVAGYFDGGFAPVKVATSKNYVRSAIGGLGQAKAGANYAASLLAAKQAKENGFDQVVWLDAKEHRYIEEMGGMNIYIVYGDTLTTCPLTGSILPGITRDSLFTLVPEMGLKIEERLNDVNEVCKDIDSGKITEIFACGTAAVVTAVSHFSHDGVVHKVGNGEPGSVTKRIYDTLTGIQYGELNDTHGWRYTIK